MTQQISEKVTIVIPVHNEAGAIESVVRDFYDKIVAKSDGVKFIIAEDGSTDGTQEVLRQLNKEIPFKLVCGKERKGFTKAFIDALSLVDTPLVFFSDSDGQYEPADFFLLLKEIRNNDIVSGYKLVRRDPWYRKWMSETYNFLLNRIFGIRMKDIDTGFKLIRKKVLDDVLNQVGSFKYCIMSEFILKAYFAGFKIKEVPITHYERKANTSTIFLPHKLPVIVGGILKNVFQLKLEMNRQKRPR